MSYLFVWLQAWFSDDEGQDLIEYVLIAGLIAVIAVAAIVATGTSVNGVWQTLQAAVAQVPGA